LLEEDDPMGTGTLLLAWLLAATPAPGDPYPIKERNFRIPIRIDPAHRKDIKELCLFASLDQGKTWQQVAVVLPDQDSFAYYAPSDGVYWFTVCAIDKNGERDPKDVYAVPPNQKILVDTLPPVVRITSAERQGNDVVVNWEMQEEHPDLDSLKLEYRTPDMAPDQWLIVPWSPASNRQARFQPKAPGPVSLRLQVQDTAGNQAKTNAEAPAALASGLNNTAGYPGGSPNPASPAPPPGQPPQWDAGAAQTASLQRTDPRFNGLTPPAQGYNSMPPSPYGQPSPVGSDPSGRMVASSGAMPGPGAMAAAGVGTSTAGRGPLPELTLINTNQVTLDYVAKAGPSGIAVVELWATRDDGRTWEKFAENQNLTPPMTITLPAEGVYGFSLVVRSRNGLGKAPPLPGDAPEIRLEYDKTLPVAELYAPVPDPSQRDALLLTWNATDRNMAANPITLEWAEQHEGPWNKIGAELPNTGRFTWQLPPNIPFRVFLRLTVRDRANNVAMAVTPRPEVIDLKEPECHLLGVRAP
jgi:hypothetical protein